MLEQRVVRWLYRRLGRRYKLAFLATQIPTSVGVGLVFVALLSSFYHPSASEIAIVAGATTLFVTIGVGVALQRYRHELSLLFDWRELEVKNDDETVAAWDAAMNLPLRSFRRNSLLTNAIAALPSIAVTLIVFDLPLSALPPMLVAATIAASYGTILTYSIAELLMRPVIEEIAESLPDDAEFTRNGLALRKRLMITLPVFAETAGLIVAALVTDHGGTRMLWISVAVAFGVGWFISMELTTLLSRAITTPISDLRKALAAVRAGDYDVRVPVVSSDDLGELSHDFNSMVRGLAEREQIREAFGTYLDKDVAGYILSGQFPPDGVEVDVSLMFVDVPGFTPLAEQRSAPEVVAALNAMFELLVPIIGRHGGHVDKFVGDGLLAVFGAPENYADHADRALAAGCEIVDTDLGLPVCVGINSGPVVAGAVGGAGRLNFSVIGDAVNVAARVEAATRQTGDSLLVTRDTRDALTRPLPLVSRGSIPLKGKSEPVELFAPASGLQRGRDRVPTATVQGDVGGAVGADVDERDLVRVEAGREADLELRDV
jgi:class 3 adenylate cyclase